MHCTYEPLYIGCSDRIPISLALCYNQLPILFPKYINSLVIRMWGNHNVVVAHFCHYFTAETLKLVR